MIDWKKIRNEFIWFKNNPNLIYFDSGATALKPNIVIDSIKEYYEIYSVNPHNTDTSFAQGLHEKIETSRQTIANFLNCHKDSIVFTSGATESLNLFAFGLMHLLTANDEIVVPDLEHASNLLPWIIVAKKTGAKLVHIHEDNNNNWVKNLLNKINYQTKIVSLSSISNLFGFSIDTKILIKKIKKINPNVIVIIDATQEVQHKKIDLQNLEIDLLAFSIHKIFGPTGVGIAYVSKKMQNILQPLKYGGGMYLDYDPKNLSVDLLSCPTKYEAGTPNVAGILGTKAAIDFVNQIGIENIHKYESELTDYLLKHLKKISNIELANKKVDSNVVSFNIKNTNPQDVAHYLSLNNIIVRSGVSCVNMLKHRKKNASGYVRVTLSIYNNINEIDQLIMVLKKFDIGDALVGLI
ncbi:aminotransferase class V-fold PLP-dependent enzyme [Mycoplasmoides alvi]|uniref:aminotransferase class V-fold PLP-dependent enzyme n=1 Tax=Mycoplasmoides alvi TaxID=78580 RepID=UPI00051C46F1|nr:aminotransferase class V-fold PLP-dependent enzyme [Mycoplasmoides alvi]